MTERRVQFFSRQTVPKCPHGGGRETPPAKKRSLEKKNMSKTYAKMMTTSVEKEGVDKKSCPESVNPERENMR